MIFAQSKQNSFSLKAKSNVNTYLEKYACESMNNHTNFFLPSLSSSKVQLIILGILKNLQAGPPALEQVFSSKASGIYCVFEYQRRQLFPRCAPGVARLSKLHWHVYQNAVSKEQHCSRFFQSIRYCDAILYVTYKY